MISFHFPALIVAALGMLASANATGIDSIIHQSTRQCGRNRIAITEDIELVARYRWNRRQTDLDTSTRFLGENVGFGCDGTSETYLEFGGDDTGAAGTEQVNIAVGQALREGAWRGTTSIVFKAQWHGEDVSEGNVQLLLEIRNTRTNRRFDQLRVIISPGVGTGCSQRLVGVAVVDETEGVYLVKANNCQA